MKWEKENMESEGVEVKGGEREREGGAPSFPPFLIPSSNADCFRRGVERPAAPEHFIGVIRGIL